MKIAYFVSGFPSLSETFVLSQITGLIDRGHDVHVYSRWRPSESAIHPDVERYGLRARTHYWPAMPAGFVGRGLKAAGLLAKYGWGSGGKLIGMLSRRRFGRLAGSLELLYAGVPLVRTGGDYDVAHAHFAPNGIHAAALREAGLHAGKVVTTFHDYGLTTYLRKWGPHVYDRLFATGDLFLAISHYARERMIGLGCPPAKVRVHRMGVDCTRFAVRAERTDDGPASILSVGRLVEKKGIEFAIRAVAELKRRGVACEYRVVGDGPLRAELDALVSELDVRDRVQLLGGQTQDRVAELLRETDIFAAPSVTAANGDEEGIPVVLMEALATGLPVVTTKHGAIPELVEHESSGLLAEERDVETLTEHLATLIADPERQRTMGQAGRARVEQEFNLARLNADLERSFQQLVAREV